MTTLGRFRVTASSEATAATTLHREWGSTTFSTAAAIAFQEGCGSFFLRLSFFVFISTCFGVCFFNHHQVETKVEGRSPFLYKQWVINCFRIYCYSK